MVIFFSDSIFSHKLFANPSLRLRNQESVPHKIVPRRIDVSGSSNGIDEFWTTEGSSNGLLSEPYRWPGFESGQRNTEEAKKKLNCFLCFKAMRKEEKAMERMELLANETCFKFIERASSCW